MPCSVVVDPRFDWAGDRAPRTSYANSVIYEVHVKGFTARHPDVPPDLRGTYAGLGHPAAVGPPSRLGVTAVELLPVHQSVTNGFLSDRGLANYWGYDTIGFFAPHAAYAAATRTGRAGGQVGEFKEMVAALHAAGIEVILDVVYNHTVEGNEYGPTLCFRGLDNPAYYRLVPDDPRATTTLTGTGNTLNSHHPTGAASDHGQSALLGVDMHVDGFRFDLPPTLARGRPAVRPPPRLLRRVRPGPGAVAGQAHRRAVGRGPGRQLRSWAGSPRCGRSGTAASATRSGTSGAAATEPWQTSPPGSAESVTCTAATRRRPVRIGQHRHHSRWLHAARLRLVQHEAQRRQRRRRARRDRRQPLVELWRRGPDRRPGVIALRRAQTRNFLATLLLSHGVPMLLGGDELGRTQGGNNNAYCQDNPTSWFDWDAVETDLLDYTTALIRLRRDHPALRARRYLSGARPGQLAWYTTTGVPMIEEDWRNPVSRTVAVMVDGSAEPDRDAYGRPIKDDDILVLINGWWEPTRFVLPPAPRRPGTPAGRGWRLELNTTTGIVRPPDPPTYPEGASVPVGPRALVLLASPPGVERP